MGLIFVTGSKVNCELVVFISLNVEGNVDLTHVKKVCGALHQGHDLVFDLGSILLVLKLVRYLSKVILMVMATKNQVNPRYLPCKLLVMLHAHVRQGNNIVAAVFFAQLFGVFNGTALVVLVDDFDLEILEHVDPLLLCDANETNLEIAYFHDSCA